MRTEGLLTKTMLFRASYSARARRSATIRASRSSTCRSAATAARTCEHELRFSLEGGQRRPFHVRLQFDQSTQRGRSPTPIAPAIIVQNAFRVGRRLGERRGPRSQRRQRHDVHAQGAALHAARRLAHHLGPQRAGAAAQHARHVHVHRPRRRTRPAVRRPSRSASARSRWRSAIDAGGGVHAGRVRPVALELRRWALRYEVADRHRRSRRARAAARRVARLPPQHDEPPRRLRLVLRLDAGAHRGRNASAWRRARPKRKSSFAIPSYPDPFGDGTIDDAARSADAADAGRTPRSCRAGSARSIGIDHQIRQGWRVNFDTFYEHTGNDFRSLDLNAPVNGVASELRRSAACCSSSRSAESTRSGINVDLSFSPRQGIFSSVRYGYSRTMNDARRCADAAADAARSRPSGRATRRGRASPQLEHRRPDSALGRHRVDQRTLQFRHAYNLTTGRDDNGDAIFNDRPAGVGRNSLRGARHDADRHAAVVDDPVGRVRTAGVVNVQRGPAVAARPRPGGRRWARRVAGIRAAGSRCTCSVPNLLNRVNTDLATSAC